MALCWTAGSKSPNAAVGRIEPSRPVRCLVTGASGFVGPHLIQHLTDCDDTVTPVGQHNGPDLRDPSGWRTLVETVRPEVIFHLAGWSDVGASWSDPVTAYQTNALGTVSVLEAARAIDGVRVVVASSADVYGLVDRSELPISEFNQPKPRSPYGASKLAAETAAQAYWQGFGVRAIVARPFNHLGPGQSDRFIAASLALQMAEAERDGGGHIVHGDLSPERDFTDVRDVVRAYRLLATDGRPGEIYNICSGNAVPIARLFQILADATTAPVEGRIDQSLVRPVDLPVLQGSYMKLHAATGWKPSVPLTETLTDILDDARRRTEPGGMASVNP